MPNASSKSASVPQPKKGKQKNETHATGSFISGFAQRVRAATGHIICLTRHQCRYPHKGAAHCETPFVCTYRQTSVSGCVSGSDARCSCAHQQRVARPATGCIACCKRLALSGEVACGRKCATALRPQRCDAARQPGPVSPGGFRRPQLPAHCGPAARAGASRRAAAAAGGGRPGRHGELRLRRGQRRRPVPGGAAAEAGIADQ
jgi:hypothetical protein